MKRGFGMKNRKHKHDDELHAQAQLNSMPRLAFQKKGRPPVKIGKGIDVQIPQDTYKTFGKHLIHYPSLRDDFKVIDGHVGTRGIE